MSVQFCQFSLLPDFDLKLVSNQNPAKRIRQNRTTRPFSVAGGGRMKQRREFSGARPGLACHVSWIFNADMHASFSFSYFVLLITPTPFQSKEGGPVGGNTTQLFS
jgi:hypothetical protein